MYELFIAIVIICGLLVVGDVVMQILDRIPCIHRLFDKLYSRLHMSRDDW